MSRILVLGAGGQVGRALKELLNSRAIILGREEADLSQPERLESILASHAPSAIINAAAYTQVDKAEEEKELAFTVNAEAPSIIARYCLEREIPFIHYSTDYVFNGEGDEPWQEEDQTAPLNTYGASKLAGEEAIAAVGGNYLIFRTSWVYDGQGKNFLNTMLRLGATKEELSIVADQFGAPTYAPHLADATLKALNHAQAKPVFPSGIYHLCHGGVTSWHGFATQIFERASRLGMKLTVKKVNAIPSSAYPTPAKRPHNSRLDCAKAKDILDIRLPAWEVGLNACMEWKASHEGHRLSA